MDEQAQRRLWSQLIASGGASSLSSLAAGTSNPERAQGFASLFVTPPGMGGTRGATGDYLRSKLGPVAGNVADAAWSLGPLDNAQMVYDSAMGDQPPWVGALGATLGGAGFGKKTLQELVGDPPGLKPISETTAKEIAKHFPEGTPKVVEEHWKWLQANNPGDEIRTLEQRLLTSVRDIANTREIGRDSSDPLLAVWPMERNYALSPHPYRMQQHGAGDVGPLDLAEQRFWRRHDGPRIMDELSLEDAMQIEADEIVSHNNLPGEARHLPPPSLTPDEIYRLQNLPDPTYTRPLMTPPPRIGPSLNIEEIAKALAEQRLPGIGVPVKVRIKGTP